MTSEEIEGIEIKQGPNYDYEKDRNIFLKEIAYQLSLLNRCVDYWSDRFLSK